VIVSPILKEVKYFMAKGIVRKLDHLGRITLPIEYRRSIGVGSLEPLELYVENRVLHLRKGKGRNIDELGRYCIPKEIRRTNKWADDQTLDIYVENGEICIEKHGEYCAICERTGELFDLYPVKKTKICKSCALAVNDMVMENGL
jgi:bifunctional DNA-binding transcriptional regulator/antitoxin component of YhaV-PrlF toxin-antitoxin module